MSDLHDKFERLARRGSPRGGDDVMTAARAAVDPDGAVLRGVDDPVTEDVATEVTVVGMDLVRRRAQTRRLGALVAAMGMAAMLFIGTLAFGAFLGSGGGSDSPEGAVRQLAAAVSQEDPIAAADVLVPEEVQSLNQTVDAAARRAQELELAKTAAAPLAGLDLSVDNLDLSTETLAEGYVKVTVSGGSISAHTDAAKFSPAVQRALGDRADDDTAQADLATLAASHELPTFVIAVQRDGHWYISAAYTTLEYIREANQLPAADFGSGVRATATLGADSPDAAVTEAMHALADDDWQKLISLAPPGEIPVYDYRDALVQLGQETETTFTVDQLDTSSTVSGDTATVKLRASGTTESGEWSIDGGCLKPPVDSSEGSVSMVGGGDWCGYLPILFGLPYYGADPAVPTASEITVVRKDGRWFVSPVGTAIDLLDRWVSNVTQRQLYNVLGVPDLLPSDGMLTLGTPVTIGDPSDGAYVYSFEARRGDRFLAVVTVPPGYEDSLPAVLIYGPDGTLMRESYGIVDGRGFEAREDGTYRIVVQTYGRDQTLTLWAEANAPEEAKHPPLEGSYEGCEPTPGGGVTCSSSGSSDSSDSSSSSGQIEESPVETSPTSVVPEASG